jgi:hypothetical protein
VLFIVGFKKYVEVLGVVTSVCAHCAASSRIDAAQAERLLASG